MSNLLNLPDLRPSLLLDFANSRQVDPRITFSRASTATRWNASGVLETVPAGVPRIDYDPATGKCLGLLVEGARTNLVRRSNELSHADWAQSALATIGAPDANLMVKLIATTENRSHDLYSASSSIGFAEDTLLTISVEAKAGGSNFFWLRCVNKAGSFQSATFNLLAGATTLRGAISSNMKSLGGGIYRCSATFNLGTGVASSAGRTVVALASGEGSGAEVFAGDGVAGVWFRNVQTEVGASPSSYIPTVAAAVTRADEFVGLLGTNFTSWHRQDEGTFLFEGAPSSIAPGYGPGLFAVGDATLSFETRNGLYLNASSGTGVLAASLAVAGASQIGTNTVTGTFAAGVSKKTAFAYQTDNTVGATDGVLGVVDTLCTIPKGLTGLSLGELSAGWTGGTSRLNGYIRRFAFYPKRLSAAELKRITEA